MIKRHFLKYMEDADFLITANNDVQGRVHTQVISEKATMVAKTGGEADSKPKQAAHPKVH